MAREKTTVTLDRAKLDEARRLSSSVSASAAIDLALTRLIRGERLRRDIAAYGEHGEVDAAAALSHVPVRWDDLDDDTDWAALYGDVE